MRHKGLRIIGPNCLGIIAPHASLNASFAADMPQTGRIAFISQSGAHLHAVLDWALQENIGFSNFVSIGNSMDIDMGDLIDYFAMDPHTDSIILYIESIENPRKFMSAGFERSPVTSLSLPTRLGDSRNPQKQQLLAGTRCDGRS